MKRMVLAGAGHAHIEVLRRFAHAPPSGVEIILVNPQQYSFYSGMLPGLVAGHYRIDECRIELAPLAGRARAQFVVEEVAALEPDRGCVHTSTGRRIAYDWLSLDVGSAPGCDIRGAAQYAHAVKPIEAFLQGCTAFFEGASRAGHARAVVVGAGAGGVELALALRYRMGKTPTSTQSSCYLLTEARILPEFPPRVRTLLEQRLARSGVIALDSVRVRSVGPGQVDIAGRAPVPSDFTVIATTAAAAPWLQQSGLAVDERGFVAVDAALRSISHPGVFAAGDCASNLARRQPKSGTQAVRQGPLLAANLRALLEAGPVRAAKPRPNAMAIISCGERYAVAVRGRWSAAGKWVWWWKDWIDRRFVRKYDAGRA